jgi:antimicrobial peptide system SdpA family protein
MLTQFKKIARGFFPYVLVCLVVLFIEDVSMQEPIVKINYRVKKIVHSVLPEGWAFFTKDPQKEMKDIYQLVNDHFVKENFSCAESVNLFGLSRKSAKISMEASFIAAQVPDNLWKTTYNENDFNTIAIVYTINDTKDLTLIKPGIYLITLYQPVPWAFAGHPENFKRQFKYIHVIIK